MKKVLALIAHNSKKEDLVSLIKAHREELIDVDLVATLGTGQLVESKAGVSVSLLDKGTRGGDLEIGALVATGEVNAVIFLCDPMTASPGEPDVSPLLRVCNIHNVPLATNLTTAEAVVHLLAEHSEEMAAKHG